MTATAEIVVAQLDDVVQVPALALRYTPPGEGPSGPGAVRSQVPTVWTLDGDATVAVEVKVLGSDGVSTAVEGIEAGTIVIVGGE